VSHCSLWTVSERKDTQTASCRVAWKKKSGKTGFAAKTGPARRAIRVSEYYRSPQPPGGVNSNNDGSDPTPMHEATKENLLALIAESDDD